MRKSIMGEYKIISKLKKYLYRTIYDGSALYIMQKYSHTYQAKSQFNIDCIKTCPFDREIFAFAYYQQTPSFVGGVAIKKIKQGAELSDLKVEVMEPILHLCWLNKAIEGKYIIGVACRQSIIKLLAYDPQTGNVELIKNIEIELNVFCLYLDLKMKNENILVIVSDNNSTVYQLQLSPSFQIVDKNQFKKHEYAVWACRFNPYKNDMFACGDEVNSLYVYQENKLILKNSQGHTAGICDIQFKDEWTMYSGGFDGVVCCFDLRKFKECVFKYDYGGTIWRIIPNQAKTQLLLCNSSEKKFQIVEEASGKEIWNSMNAHQSLAYAADWNQSSLITASFYDKTINYWKIE